jgi:murein L,D-transpeptidase YafK
VRLALSALVLVFALTHNDVAFRDAQPVTSLTVLKAKRELHAYSGARLVKKYRVGLGFTPHGTKEKQGDGRTPEGSYVICNKNPYSRYYLSLQINYPNKVDADRAFARRAITRQQHSTIARAAQRNAVPPANTALGGEIFIHGHGSSSDWTLGCIALDDNAMKELYDSVAVGTPVIIRP